MAMRRGHNPRLSLGAGPIAVNRHSPEPTFAGFVDGMSSSYSRTLAKRAARASVPHRHVWAGWPIPATAGVGCAMIHLWMLVRFTGFGARFADAAARSSSHTPIPRDSTNCRAPGSVAHPRHSGRGLTMIHPVLVLHLGNSFPFPTPQRALPQFHPAIPSTYR
jgi:hypothetical protein